MISDHIMEGFMLTDGPCFPDRNEIEQAARYFYGCAYKDKYLLYDPASLPRYGYLARKVLSHYLGDQYNPHTIPMEVEYHFRLYIKEMIEYKIMYRTKGYDWQWIDHFFRKAVCAYFDFDIAYDMKLLDRGLDPAFSAPVLTNYELPN